LYPEMVIRGNSLPKNEAPRTPSAIFMPAFQDLERMVPGIFSGSHT
jgi:hypothetical protein